MFYGEYSGTSLIRTFWGPSDLFELEKFSNYGSFVLDYKHFQISNF